MRGGISLGVVSGVLCLFNPVILQVLIGWFIVGMLLFKNHRLAFFRFMAVAALMIVICLSPWAIRNRIALGGIIWTRDNFGLELQVSNNDAATADAEQNNRSPDIPHPYGSIAERQRVRHMGELAYQRTKQEEALLWIRNHPAHFIHLVAGRLLYFWFPPMPRWWQSIAEAALTVAAIAGLASLFKATPVAVWLFLTVLVFYPAVSTCSFKYRREYRLPIEPVLFFLAGSFCLRLSDWCLDWMRPEKR